VVKKNFQISFFLKNLANIFLGSKELVTYYSLLIFEGQNLAKDAPPKIHDHNYTLSSSTNNWHSSLCKSISSNTSLYDTLFVSNWNMILKGSNVHLFIYCKAIPSLMSNCSPYLDESFLLMQQTLVLFPSWHRMNCHVAMKHLPSYNCQSLLHTRILMQLVFPWIARMVESYGLVNDHLIMGIVKRWEKWFSSLSSTKSKAYLQISWRRPIWIWIVKMFAQKFFMLNIYSWRRFL
jgi:hypothetical protein